MLMNFMHDFPDHVQRISWMVDGRIAFVWLNQIGNTSPRLAIAKPDGSQVESQVGHVYGAIAASPTNPNEIMVVQGREIRLWTPYDTEDKVHPILTAAEEAAGQAAWSPNGEFFAIIGTPDQERIGRSNNGLVIFDRQMKIVQESSSQIPYQRLSWGPLNNQLAYDQQDQSPVTYFLKVGGTKIEGETGFTHFTYSPIDFRFTCILYPRHDLRQLIYREPDTDKQHLLTEYQISINGAGYNWLKWSPNGRYIAFDKFHGTHQNLFVYDTTTGQIQSYQHPDKHLFFDYPTWSPDSTVLALLSQHGVSYLIVSSS